MPGPWWRTLFTSIDFQKDLQVVKVYDTWNLEHSSLLIIMIFIPFSLFVLLVFYLSGLQNERMNALGKIRKLKYIELHGSYNTFCQFFLLLPGRRHVIFPYIATPLPACAAIFEHLVSSLLSLKVYLAQPVADLIVTEDFTATLVLRKENTVSLKEMKDNAKILCSISSLYWVYEIWKLQTWTKN